MVNKERFENLMNCKRYKGSNGGLLVGNMFVRQLKRKERKLFNAVVCEVPLLDMMRYHLLLAGNSWVAEYGSFDVEEDR